MSGLNERTANLLQAQVRALHVATGYAAAGLPVSSSLTALMRHGGVYTLTDREMMAARLSAVASTDASPSVPMDVPFLMAQADGIASFFFYHLLSENLTIPQNLISYLTFPEDGKTHTHLGHDRPSPNQLPAAFTFIGQFIDHDLTMNVVNLFDPQTGVLLDKASPLIDLDSVYGPRPAPAAPLFTGDKFDLRSVATNVFDYKRNSKNMALIADARNDENEILAQVQILLMRLHNFFIDDGLSFLDARQETIFNWQSVVLNDYLPRICNGTALASVTAALNAKDYTKLKHHPLVDSATGSFVVSMPHEFAIAFRFGHSQIRDFYQLNSSHPPNPEDHGHHTVRLFDNRNPHADDLRGGKPLSANHGIDWPFFLSVSGHPARISNRIDSKVAEVVFDLPASTIPDDIKFVSNLAQRNLIRSSQIGLGSGEALADVYDPGAKLSPAEIEPHSAARVFFKNDRDTSEPPAFRTPLWYYVLKEAELAAEGHFGIPARGFLGPVGSRLVAEVVAGGVYYNPAAENMTLNPSWQSTIASGPDKRKVLFEDIVARVTV